MKMHMAIVFVGDMDRCVAFYRDVVGLPLRFASPEWSEFATDGATLALHAAADGERGDAGAAGTCRPGFTVDDVDAFHARMVEHGVTCLLEPRDLHGVRLATYADPDGLPFGASGSAG